MCQTEGMITKLKLVKRQKYSLMLLYVLSMPRRGRMKRKDVCTGSKSDPLFYVEV